MIATNADIQYQVWYHGRDMDDVVWDNNIGRPNYAKPGMLEQVAYDCDRAEWQASYPASSIGLVAAMQQENRRQTLYWWLVRNSY